MLIKIRFVEILEGERMCPVGQLAPTWEAVACSE